MDLGSRMVRGGILVTQTYPTLLVTTIKGWHNMVIELKKI